MHWNFKPEAPYFVLDPEGDGITYFETIEERDAFAASRIDGYKDVDNSWAEAVDYIIAGVVTHRATQTDREDRPDDLDEEGNSGDGSNWEEDEEYRCNYKLLPLAENPDNTAPVVEYVDVAPGHELAGAAVFFRNGRAFTRD